MDADHRHVCKFDSPSDPNYKILRNALLTDVDAIRSSRPETPPPQPSSLSGPILQLSSAPSLSDATAAALLRSFLGTGDSFETDLATLQVLKQPGHANGSPVGHPTQPGRRALPQGFFGSREDRA